MTHSDNGGLVLPPRQLPRQAERWTFSFICSFFLSFNNNELGKISLEQRTAGIPVWQTDLSNTSYAEYARLCGTHGVRVDSRANLDDTLREVLQSDGPSLVEVMTDPELI